MKRSSASLIDGDVFSLESAYSGSHLDAQVAFWTPPTEWKVLRQPGAENVECTRLISATNTNIKELWGEKRRFVRRHWAHLCISTFGGKYPKCAFFSLFFLFLFFYLKCNEDFRCWQKVQKWTTHRVDPSDRVFQSSPFWITRCNKSRCWSVSISGHRDIFLKRI